MALLDKLHASTLAARKASLKSPDDLTEDEKAIVAYAVFLVTLLADINSAAKADGNRAPTDADADKVVRSQAKSLRKGLDTAVEEAVKAVSEEGDPEAVAQAKAVKADAVRSSTWYSETQAKVAFLENLIPAPLDQHHLTMAITDAAADLDTKPVMREMGRIMKALNEKYPGQIDGALVRKLIEAGAC